jgi:hypothetical protein
LSARRCFSTGGSSKPPQVIAPDSKTEGTLPQKGAPGRERQASKLLPLLVFT